MEKDLVALLLSLILFHGFWGLILYKFGMTRSISKSYYLFDNKWTFVIGTLLYALPIFFVEHQWLRYAGVFLMLVAAAPAGRAKGLEGWMHVIGAWGAIVCGLIFVALQGIEGSRPEKIIYWGLIIVYLGFVVWATNKPLKNHTTYIEVAAVDLILGVAIVNQIV